LDETKVTVGDVELPNSTVDEEVKFLPVIFTSVDPVAGPFAGEIFVTVGPVVLLRASRVAPAARVPCAADDPRTG
jgi:hypothetical protein